jgi:hypothetical protein
MAIFYNPNKKKGLFFMPSGATGGARLAIEYSAARFCEDGTDPIPGITGDTGGTFSSTTGLVFISTSTGQVDLSASTAGTYIVTYTAPSSDTATTSISVDSIPVVSAGANVDICNGENTILTATGATTYSWSTGQTGASITVDPTTDTTYTVTGFNGACSATDSVDVTVYALPTVSITGTLTYCAGASTTLDAGSFVSYLWSNGETTQTISATAGNYTVTVTDSNGCSNTSAQVTVTETSLDVATVVYDSSSYCQVPTGALAVEGYYPLYSTESASNAVSSDGTSHSHTLSGTTYYMPNAGIVVYHGTYSLTATPTITGESGTFNSPSGLSIDANGVIDKNASTAGTYSVEYTTTGSCPITVTNSITITALDNATFAYGSSAYCDNVTDPTPTKSATGIFSSSTGLNINTSTGEVDLDASTAGTYVVGFVTSGSCPNSSIQTLTINAAPTVAISGTLSYCAGSNTTLTATAGLSSYLWSSGETTQSITATAGSYTVTGTDSNGCSNTSSSVTVTETALDNAAFAYSASSYEPTDSDPTPTITGLTGGTFSGTTGLVINSTTGEIDLSASTVASHTITYDTTSSGSSVCPNTSTQTVDIALAGIANNYSMSFDGSNDYIDVGDSDSLSFTNGSNDLPFTFSSWVYFDSVSGARAILGKDNGTQREYALFSNSGKLKIFLKHLGGGTQCSRETNNVVFSTGQWYHVAASYDGSGGSTAADGITLYINGVVAASTATNNGSYSHMSNTTADFNIGRYSGAFAYFNGLIDELAVWNTALTDGTGGTVNQIAEIYNATGTNLTKDLTTVSGSNLIYWNRMGD